MRIDPRVEQDALDLNTLSTFLARRGVSSMAGQTFDLVILLGNSVLESARLCAQVLVDEVAPEALLSGGIGHSTPHLYKSAQDALGIDGGGRPEAEVLREAIIAFGGPSDRLLLETTSTNCGANARKSRRVLDEAERTPSRVLLVQDPTMQLRTHVSFTKVWSDRPEVQFVSYAPVIPRVVAGADGLSLDNPDVLGLWAMDRFISLTLGEIPRLRNDHGGYGPLGKGFIDPVTIPEVIEQAFARLSKRTGSGRIA